MFDLCVKGGILIDAGGRRRADLYVKDGKIAAIARPDAADAGAAAVDAAVDAAAADMKDAAGHFGLALAGAGGAPVVGVGAKEHSGAAGFLAKKTVDASGKYVFPGFVDPHTHLNDPPGGDVSEDFYTGTCSAAAGGVTTVIEMPLTTPVVATEAAFTAKRAICGPKAVVDFAMFGACTPDNQDEILRMRQEGAAAFKAFMPYSTEIPRLNDGELWRAMERLAPLGILLSLHCENADMIAEFTAELRSRGKVQPRYYAAAHPEISEIEAVSRAALFAYKTGAKVHVCHCSLGEAVDIVDYYKGLGADITVETCPHYLTLDESYTERLGPYCVCNPPLRSRQAKEELWKRVLQGKVDFIGTDHSAYLHSEKAEGNEDIFAAPPGITAMQLCFPLFFSEAVNKRGMSPERFAEMSCAGPAKRHGLYPRKGSLEPGADADFVIFAPEEEWVIEEKDLFYLEKWTPNAGSRVKGRVKETIVRGMTVFKDGVITAEPGYGKFVPAI